MPSSKRNRVLPTSKTRKNHKELVRRLHANIQEAAREYSHIWVFDVDNVRTNHMKQVRTDFNDSRIIQGKTKVMMVALGRTPEEECVPGVSALQQHVRGEIGLLFTNRAPAEVQTYFDSYRELDYARSGAEAGQNFTIPPGELRVAGDEEELLPMSIEPTLRRLGVPTRIVKGKVVLEETPEGVMTDDSEEGYRVCREGDVLDSRQTSILKIFGVRMSEFRMNLRAVYDKAGESVRSLEAE